MRILILGDVEGLWGDATDTLEEAREEDGPFDWIIQVGDMGFAYPGTRPWPADFDERCMWIDGNHDNHELLSKRDEVNFGHDPYHVLWPTKWEKFLRTWEYKPRGSYENGILFVGGASSIDKQNRRQGFDWWPGEDISYEDEQRVLDTIEDVGPENIHTVISHDCPSGFAMIDGLRFHQGDLACEFDDSNRKFLEHVRQEVQPERWYFGHYHFSWTGILDGCDWQCLNMVGFDRDYAVLEL